MRSPQRTTKLQRAILRWYRASARDFPWRKTRDPYRILVSEVMLQQTQVGRVVDRYRAFLRQFPNVRRLASATPGTVLLEWRGLGYNMRALRLHATARTVTRTLRGRFPRDVEALEQLPGIGAYTARAVACFSFGTAVPVLDTNVRRVLSRVFPDKARAGNLWELAAQVLPTRSAYDWNQALMELGSTICTAASPSCPECPIRSHCPSAGRNVRVLIPRKSRERLHHGQPRRIYRGRIVALLAGSGVRVSAGLSTIGRAVLKAHGPEHEGWLREVVSGLERDGLVRVIRRGRHWSVSLVR